MNSRMKRVALAAAALGGAAAFLGACQSMAKAPEWPPLGLVSQVDLSRFMGRRVCDRQHSDHCREGLVSCRRLRPDHGDAREARLRLDHGAHADHEHLQKLITFVGKQGYDTSKLERVPQQAGG